jgi:hypothetical protein
MHQGALTGPGSPDKGDGLTLSNIKIDPLQNINLGGSVAEGLMDPPDLKETIHI